MKFANSLFHCFHPSTLSLTAGSTEEEEEEEKAGGLAIPNPDFRVFTYNELKAATQGFRNKIGEGAFGSVYRGRLIGDEKLIAVKVASVEVETMRGEREFISEIAALSDIKHQNLLTLNGCCVHGPLRLLVYHYMPNNSLTHTFLGAEHNRVKFTWTLRKHVTLGIARGLCYLHEEINPHIVHRDIKASNILLDHDFTPKLGDFGLAKLFRDDASHISTRVAGTLGYLSPEYAHTGHLTRKSDVYSFGVVVLEIVSGRPVVDYHQQYGEQFLVEKAWELYNAKRLIELVDCALKSEFSDKEAVRFLKVGLLCVQATTRLRPAMSIALKMLNNEIDIEEDIKISQPGLIADLMEVKIRLRLSSNFSSSPASVAPVVSKHDNRHPGCARAGLLRQEKPREDHVFYTGLLQCKDETETQKAKTQRREEHEQVKDLRQRSKSRRFSKLNNQRRRSSQVLPQDLKPRS